MAALKLFLLATYCSFAAALWPIPVKYTNGTSVLWLQNDTPVTYKAPSATSTYALNAVTAPTTAPQATASGSVVASDIVDTALQNAYDTIFTKSYVPWKFHPRMSNFEPSTSYKKYISGITLVQSSTDPGSEIKPTDGQLNESYSLQMTTAGAVTITAQHAVGLAWGLSTFTQLFYEHSAGGSYSPLAPVSITDSPKFEHRGLNMDVSRNYYSVSSILRTLDGISYNKMNRLHLHITDAQSWPLQVPSIPSLSSEGAYRQGAVYTTAQLSQIQQYGALRGVEVYIEIDMPGHTSSIAYSHPDLIAAFNVQPNWQAYCGEPPCGTFKLNSSEVYTFLDNLFADVLPRVKPYTSYFHTGGDEVNYNAYTLDPTVKSNATSVIKPLLQKFVNTAHQHVRNAGMIPMAWEEVITSYNLTVGKDVIIQTWLSDASVASVTAMGHKALAGNYEYWYLDCGHGQWINFENGKATQTFFPFTDYCDPLKNWRLIYSYDPLSGVAAANQHLVLGGETHIWSEQIDDTSLDGILWPRGAAAAEVLWSGAKDPATGQNRSEITAAPRLSDMRERLVARGIASATVQMPFCLQGIDQCSITNEYA